MKTNIFKGTLIIIMMLTLLLSGCSGKSPNGTYESGLKVYTSFYPVYYLAEQIGRDRIDLNVIIPNGSEPHDYEPSMKEMADVENGSIFIFNGAGMEPWAEKLAHNLNGKGIKTLNLSQYVKLIEVFEEEHDDHEDEDHNHDHGLYDPHIWLDPINMERMAYEIMIEFSKLDNKNEDFYKRNYEELSLKLKELDLKYQMELSNKNRDTILVSHQAFGYMTKRYGLKQVSVTGITPHEEPSPKTIARLLDIIKDEGYEFIFLESLASPKVVELLAQEGNLKILELNPIGGLTKEQQDSKEDYITLMEQNLENLKKALVK
ncbi:zinc transport system substrate-binding protein [Proteiniborus ethanoligenes]|uniref:Zinc transport system substrate-binding protein n=1 Tax=Proteiniborus ethanoligenes TaxID=415015 RepID=A0A1H3PZR9_9FIRM|nr:zinc ABC transporter substrate-binding protein [Proteiniborus ethanoligenes]SDZ06784.1 zinc transport system substrate-binding protein [Proteiniborus ethanoligenes]